MEPRNPYVGSGADGARRSAEVDRSEADTLPVGERRDQLLLSAERWILQAEQLEAAAPDDQPGGTGAAGGGGGGRSG